MNIINSKNFKGAVTALRHSSAGEANCTETEEQFSSGSRFCRRKQDFLVSNNFSFRGRILNVGKARHTRGVFKASIVSISL